MDAGNYTGFHKALAQKIKAYLEPDDTLCDIGCGLGRLDFEIAPYVKGILAIDVSEYAIAKLQEDVERAGVGNIRAACGDADELEGDFDVILLSLFGRMDTYKLLKHCRRRLIRIVGAGSKSGLYPEAHRRETKNAVPDIRSELSALGIDYRLEFCSFEFGQPLRTLKDAESFVLSNAPEAGAEEIREFLDINMERTGRDDIPFYLPYRKELGVFIIDKPRETGA